MIEVIAPPLTRSSRAEARIKGSSRQGDGFLGILILLYSEFTTIKPNKSMIFLGKAGLRRQQPDRSQGLDAGDVGL